MSAIHLTENIKNITAANCVRKFIYIAFATFKVFVIQLCYDKFDMLTMTELIQCINITLNWWYYLSYFICHTHVSLKCCDENKNQRFLFFGVLGDRESMDVRERWAGHKLWMSLWTTWILSLLHPTGAQNKWNEILNNYYFFRAIVVNHGSMVWVWCALTMADWQWLVYT